MYVAPFLLVSRAVTVHRSTPVIMFVPRAVTTCELVRDTNRAVVTGCESTPLNPARGTDDALRL